MLELCSSHARHARINQHSSRFSFPHAQKKPQHVIDPPQSVLRILFRPLLSVLCEGLLVVLEFRGNVLLHRIVGQGLLQDLANEEQHRVDLRIGFPLIGAKQAQAHTACPIVGNIWVVYFSLEVEGRRFERVIIGHGDEEVEYATLEEYRSAH